MIRSFPYGCFQGVSLSKNQLALEFIPLIGTELTSKPRRKSEDGARDQNGSAPCLRDATPFIVPKAQGRLAAYRTRPRRSRSAVSHQVGGHESEAGKMVAAPATAETVTRLAPLGSAGKNLTRGAEPPAGQFETLALPVHSAKVPGSSAWVLNRNDLTSRFAANAAGTPITIPIPVRSSARRRTIQITSLCCAPRAIRMPISSSIVETI